MTVEQLQAHINQMVAGKIDLGMVEMNQRADMVMYYDVDIRTAVAMSDSQANAFMNSIEYGEEVVDHEINCRNCRKVIGLKSSMWTDNHDNGCGWVYECKCGHTGWIWEGAFDWCEEDFK